MDKDFLTWAYRVVTLVLLVIVVIKVESVDINKLVNGCAAGSSSSQTVPDFND